MHQFVEINVSQLESGKEYHFTQPLIIRGDIPPNVIIKVTNGDLRIEGDLQERVSLECNTLISVTGNIAAGCFLAGGNIIVSGDVLPGMFAATELIRFNGKVTYKIPVSDSEQPLEDDIASAAHSAARNGQAPLE